MLASFFKVFFSLIFLSLLFVIYACSSHTDDTIKKKVYIEKTETGYQLIRNGSPFYIKGVSGDSYYEELKTAGGNTIRVYDTVNMNRKLRLADSLGLAVIVDIPLQVKNFSQIDPKDIDWITNFVNKYKTHPALLYWMLGNEVYFPQFVSSDFVDSFNALVKRIHEIDPDHPVSTAISVGAVKEVLAIVFRSKELDFISMNVFGRLNNFAQLKKRLFVWQKPYVISEWGNNGPWESNATKWQAPLEQTSTEKAEQVKNRYLNFIATLDDERCLGSLAFFWGQKQETTHTWFSMFSHKGHKTQAIFELENVWQNKNRLFTGPKINDILLNQQASWASTICLSREMLTGDIVLNENSKKYTYTWEVLPENWFKFSEEYKNKPTRVELSVAKETLNQIRFKAPKKEGAYRLHYTIEGEGGYIATANIPFYVIGKKP